MFGVQRFPKLKEHQAKWLLLAVISLGCGLLWTGAVKDDLRLLQNSPSQLLAQERKVGQLLDQFSATQFLLVRGENRQQVLEREEALAKSLAQLSVEHPRFKFQMLSQWVPSTLRQHANREWVEALYQQQLNKLLEPLGTNALKQRADQALQHSVEGEFTPLTAEQFLNTAFAQQLPVQIVQSVSGEFAGIVRLAGLSPAVVARLAQMTDGDSSLIYVDRISDLSQVFNTYRSEIIKWVCMAYLMVLLLLLVRYKAQVWRVFGPPLTAALLVAGVIAHLPDGLNLFHLLALLLVLGLGLDMGIFLQEGRGHAHVWLAVSLSMFTSLLAFGLLVLSATPVLHYFGLTVLLGLVVIWVLAMLMRRAQA